MPKTSTPKPCRPSRMIVYVVFSSAMPSIGAHPIRRAIYPSWRSVGMIIRRQSAVGAKHNSLPLLKPLRRVDATLRFLSCEPLLTPLPDLSLDGIGWVIGGGQSGQGAVCGNPKWIRDLRDLCVANSVPFFLKQWGTDAANPTPREQELDPKAKGGATLDGRLWREFPTVIAETED